MATTTISDISNAVVFYVEDIIFNEATLDKNKIKEILNIKHQKEKNKKNSK